MTLFFQQLGVWEAPAKGDPIGAADDLSPASRWGHPTGHAVGALLSATHPEVTAARGVAARGGGWRSYRAGTA